MLYNTHQNHLSRECFRGLNRALTDRLVNFASFLVEYLLSNIEQNLLLPSEILLEIES